MAETAAFVGGIPERYDRCLGPMLFMPFAREMGEGLRFFPGIRILELAAGTGIVSAEIAKRLPADGQLVVTDLNEPMLEIAKTKIDAANVEFRQADACELPFEDASFDAVVCQFGLMFFPDKDKALREILRVLKPGGVLRFNVWDHLDHNQTSLTIYQTVSELFPQNPPQFMLVPFSLYDVDAVVGLVKAAGFEVVNQKTVQFPSESESVELAVEGGLQGNPMAAELEALGPGSLERAQEALREKFRSKFGDHPMRASIQAHIIEGKKP